MKRKITVSTNKGGVLKTSLVTNLSGVFSNKGRVLIIDADNQGNALLSFGVNPDTIGNSIYEVLLNGVDYHDAIINVAENIDILPSNDEMAFFEFDVLTNIKKYPNPFNIMKNSLKGIEQEYDYILIDTPPNLGLVHGNALCISEDILIPFQPESYSMRSLVKIINSIEQFKGEHNSALNIIGVVGTLVDSRTVLHSDILQECRRFCYEKDLKMFDTVIPRSIRFASSVAYDGKPATLLDKDNELIKSYYKLEGEILND